MPTNPLIALQGTSINTAPAIQNLRNNIVQKKQLDRQEDIDTRNAETQGKQNELLDEQLLDARSDRVLRNIAPKAQQLDRFLADKNFDGAMAFLKQNRLELGEQIAQGASVDTIDTDEAIAQLESGDIEGLRSNLGTIVQAARVKKYLPEAQEVVEVLDADQAREQLGIDLKPGTVVQRTSKEGQTTGINILQKSDVKSQAAVDQEIDIAQRNQNIEDGSALNQAKIKEVNKKIEKLDKELQPGSDIKESDISGIRKEFTKASGDFVKIKDAFARVKDASDTAAGDINLIFGFMKLNDPGSTVREGEFATAQNAAGIPGRIRSAYNNALNGTRLNPDQRENFKAEAEGLFNSQLTSQLEIEKQFGSLAERKGINKDDVVLDLVGRFRPEPPAGGQEDIIDPSSMSDDDIKSQLGL